MEYLPRKIEEKLDKWYKKEKVIIIKGIRQSGKTTLIKHLSKKYNGIYVDLEDFDLKESLEKNPKLFFYRYLKNERTYIFLDEAQRVKEIGKIIKFIFDNFKDKIHITLTGSGDFDIKNNVGKYLVGRAIYFTLYPLDFEEFLIWKAKDLYKIYKELTIEDEIPFYREFLSLFEEFLIFGGFPEVVKENSYEDKKEILKNLYITYLEKDVFNYFNIFEKEKFENLIKFLAFNIGNLLNLSNISKDFRISYKTLERYLTILKETYFLFLLNPFFRNLSTELKKQKKIYLIDNGLRNYIVGNFLGIDRRDDLGKLLENFVYLELIKNGFEVYYWRTIGKNEVDFIIKINENIIPIEVKVKEKIRKGFYYFLESYRPKFSIVFYLGKEIKVKEYKGVKIYLLPIIFAIKYLKYLMLK